MTTFPKNFSISELPKTFSVSDLLENGTWDPTFTESPREFKDPNGVHSIFGPSTLVSMGRGDSSQDLQGRPHSHGHPHGHVSHPTMHGPPQQVFHGKIEHGSPRLVKAAVPTFSRVDAYEQAPQPARTMTEAHGVGAAGHLKAEPQEEAQEDEEDKEYGPDEELTPEELANKHKKERRMLSNRESARRSRQRKQHHLDDLQTKVSQLRADNGKLMERLSMVNHHYSNILEENRKLSNERERLSLQLERQSEPTLKEEEG